MELLAALSMAFGSFCFQMAEAISPDQCELSCECADNECRQFQLKINHQMGQTALVVRNGEHLVEVSVDGLNSEKSYRLNDTGQDLRIWKELHGQKIKAVRLRTAKSELYCSQQ